jgi:large subunit ribosomal protein L27
MAHKKQGGKASQHISPSGKRLGVKVSDGGSVAPGSIIIRQRGTKIKAGKGVKVGRDHTIYANESGVVSFAQRLGRKVVSVLTK